MPQGKPDLIRNAQHLKPSLVSHKRLSEPALPPPHTHQHQLESLSWGILEFREEGG